MSIRDRIQKAATIVLSSVGQTFKQPYFWTYSDLDTVLAKSGVSLSNQNALQVSAYFSGVSLLAQTVGQLPLILYERMEPRGKRRAQGSQLYDILHNEPNPYMSAYTLKETLEGHAVTWGNAYAEIAWDLSGGWDNRIPEGLWPLRPDRMEVMWTGGKIVYNYQLPTGERQTLQPEQVLHIPGFGFDGLVGYDPLWIAREALGLAKATEEFGARFFANGSALNGVLEHPGGTRPLTKEAVEMMRSSWEGIYKGLSHSHRVAILQEGVKYQQIGIPPEDAQFLETRKFQVAEIARILHVPPHMLGDLERSTNNNIEEQALEFVKYTMMPWLVRWEQEVTRKLISPAARKRYFAEFLVDGLLRGNSVARGDYYTKLFNIGVFSPNDIREKENLNPIEGGDEYYVPLNMIPTSMAGQEPQEPVKALALKAMSPEDWEDAYSEGVPHWATDLTPSKFAQEFLVEMQERKVASVLEIGCGNGRDSILFARAGVAATAIDVTEGAIKLATENARAAEVTVNLSVANAEKLPFSDGEFGAVFSLSVLHASRLSLSIPEAYRVLKATGIGFIYLYGDTQFADGHREEYTTVDGFTELLKGAGFTLLDFYSEQEDEFDEYGEKHQILVTLVQK